MRLSVILITKNEAANLRACIESVAFADQIVVVDSGSTDGTVALARELGATVLETDWPGFGPQKNRALDLADGDWVLSIDADERVTPSLAAEIRQVLAAPQFDAYEIPRLSSYCGRFIRHSGWWPDPVLRLFKRGAGRFTDVPVHERVDFAGPKGMLNAWFEHYTYPDLESALVKMNRYSTDAAQAMHARGKKSSLMGALLRGFWTFVRIYLLRRGFLDGREGFLLAVTAGTGNFYRYAKLAQLNRQTRA
ncbi:glycosyltransferase involved in cell wall biosynthesis [Silvimonas terrae]|uniref:Glycosyltransferase involved in cell wall biosynthesis n=1 Tax=Silvimonas terrae TaxID=300266 RepID=A0A840RFB4_9NEIS|nr:glycosyltransferase family 2 protein [Silvimonas terrae]MBB5192025.1 glycosyltransferase involved in cell wall biosynthesis [Silvimonas terrae]